MVCRNTGVHTLQSQYVKLPRRQRDLELHANAVKDYSSEVLFPGDRSASAEVGDI